MKCKNKIKNIILYFNKDIDPNSVTQESVVIKSTPVSGSFDYNQGRMKREQKIYKIVSVENNKIILEL